MIWRRFVSITLLLILVFVVIISSNSPRAQVEQKRDTIYSFGLDVANAIYTKEISLLNSMSVIGAVDWSTIVSSYREFGKATGCTSVLRL